MPNGFKIDIKDVAPVTIKKSWWKNMKDFGKNILKTTWNVVKWFPPVLAVRTIGKNVDGWYNKITEAWSSYKKNKEEIEAKKGWEEEEEKRKERIKAEKSFSDYVPIPEDAKLDALLSRKVYKARRFVELPAGVREATDEELAKFGMTRGDLVDTKSGFRMRVYFNENTGKFTLSFAGTDPKDPNDVETDVRQARGLKTDQYDMVSRMGNKIAEKIRRGELDRNILAATGQSLGGGLAGLFGAITKCETHTFNAAGVHRETLKRAGVNPDDIKARNFPNITNHVAQGDILTYLQEEATAEDLQKVKRAVDDVVSIPILGRVVKYVGQDKVNDSLSPESLEFIKGRLDHISDVNEELPDALGTRVDYGSKQRVEDLDEKTEYFYENLDHKTDKVVVVGVKLYDGVQQHGNY